MKINVTPNITAMVTAHGTARSHLHIFNTNSPQNAHALTETKQWTTCSKFNNEREKLIAYISKEDNWPVKKTELVNN